jgi:hypothetical protein
MKKLILFFISFAILTSCGGNDELPETLSEEENIDNLIKLNLNELPEIILSEIKVISPFGEMEINVKGEFEKPATDENSDLPLLFKNNANEIIIGYFPETIKESNITLNDITYFFFKTFPRIASRNEKDADLYKFLTNSADFITMKELVYNSISKNQSVIYTEIFNSLVRKNAQLYIDNNTSNKTKGKFSSNKFNFQFDRTGNVTIPTEAPLFCSLGIQIKNTENNEVVFGPKMTKPKSLILSPGSLLNFIAQEYILEPDITSETFQFIENGIYEIQFTNGNSKFGDIESNVKNENYSQFAINALGLAVPLSLDKLLKNKDCKDQISDLINNSIGFAKNLTESNTKPTVNQLLDFIKDLGENMIKLTICYKSTNNNLADYFSQSLKFLNKRLSIAEDISELVLFSKDFWFSDISGSETRYFSDQISTGELMFFENTKYNLDKVDCNEEVNFQTLISEKIVNYDVSNEIPTVFSKVEEYIPAEGLPFDIQKTTGNSELIDLPLFLTSNSDVSNIDLKFKIGNEESEYILKPNFTKHNLNEEKITIPSCENQNYLTERVLNISKWLWNNSINQTFSASFFADGTCTFNAFAGTDGTWSLQDNILTAHFDELTNDWDFDFQGAYNENTGRFEGDVIQSGTGIPTSTLSSELY